MNIIVFVKQIPDMVEMSFDHDKKVLIRDGVRNILNPFDRRAIAEAIKIKATNGGEVTAITMGPPQAREALYECLAVGADKAIHLLDQAFAGADTLATARALAAATQRLPFDLVLCGKSSVDAETGQVGPEVAELLDVPQITAVRRLDLDPARRRVKAERETDAGFESVECNLPALVSATEDLAAERFPKRAEKEAAKAKPIVEVTASDLSADVEIFGTAGSPTRVEGLETVVVERQGRLFDGEPEVTVRALVAALVERGVFD